jgi:hypothetical protein
MEIVKEILCNRGEENQVEQEEKFNFLISILQEFQIPLDIIKDESTLNFDPALRSSFRKLLQSRELKFEEHNPKEFSLYHLQSDKEKIIPVLLAWWKKPTFELKQEDKEVFIKMKLNCWTLLEENK